jgi:hypothetical protein
VKLAYAIIFGSIEFDVCDGDIYKRIFCDCVGTRRKRLVFVDPSGQVGIWDKQADQIVNFAKNAFCDDQRGFERKYGAFLWSDDAYPHLDAYIDMAGVFADLILDV